MNKIAIRDYESKDQDRVLELNEELVHFLSPLSEDRLKKIVNLADMVKVVEVDGSVEAFLITVSQDSEYDSVNYQWFNKNYKDFLYVDRVVVSPSMHRKGLGKALYKEAFNYARDQKLSYVTAEIDIKPANPVSLDFHKTLGFKEVDTQSVYDGAKVVSLQVAKI